MSFHFSPYRDYKSPLCRPKWKNQHILFVLEQYREVHEDLFGLSAPAFLNTIGPPK
jgi:transposase-like protein